MRRRRSEGILFRDGRYGAQAADDELVYDEDAGAPELGRDAEIEEGPLQEGGPRRHEGAEVMPNDVTGAQHR